MRWLLDTCVVSELKRRQPHPAVVAWIKRNEVFSALSMVTLGEILHGIERLPLGAGRLALQAWLDQVCAQYADRTLPAGEKVWRTYSRLCASVEAIGRPQDDFDLLIAATASVNGLAVVTRNTRHFEDTGVAIVNPWDDAAAFDSPTP